MRAVNLLPRDLESNRDFGGRTPLLVAAGGIAAVTAAAVVLFMSASGSVSDQTSQLESLEAAIASVPSPNQPAVAPAGITQERADRVAAFSAALTYRVPLDRLLRELAYVLPEDAWLTGLTAAGFAELGGRDRARSRNDRAGSDDPGSDLLASLGRSCAGSVRRDPVARPCAPDRQRAHRARCPAARAEGVRDEGEEEAHGRDLHHRRGPRERDTVKARIASLPPRAVLGIAVAAVLVYAIAVWFLLVAPKRADVAKAGDAVAAAQLRLADARLEARRPTRSGGTRVVDVMRLAKAMPSSADQAGLVLELDRLARAAGVTLESITPKDPVVADGSPTMIPVVVTADGSYRQITRFLNRTRGLVQVRHGAVRATGRLLTVQSVELSESNAKRFPFLDATITLNAFVYDGPIVPVAPPPLTTDSESSSTGATAAGSTP